MNSRRRKTRIAGNWRPVLSLLAVFAIVIQPLDLRAAGAPCAPPGHECCEHLHGVAGASCPLPGLTCSAVCSQDQSVTFVGKSLDASGLAKLYFVPLSHVVVPAYSKSLAQLNRAASFAPVSPPLTPLSQSCLLLI